MSGDDGTRHRVVFPEGAEPRILHAARRIVDEGIAAVALLGRAENIGTAAQRESISLDGVDLVDPASSERLDAFANLYQAGRDSTRAGIAARLVRKPLYFGAMMVKAGDADLTVAGVANPTRRVIEAASLCIGFAPGITVPSSYFIINVPGREAPLLFADCAVNVDPDAGQLAQIAVASAHSTARHFAAEPRVAMLSFSTLGSADHPHARKIAAAVEIARDMAPELLVEGEFQADTALSKVVAESKVKIESAVAGRANVLVFPDLNSGNIAYKLVQQLAGARVMGPLLQGFALPVADLSRGASVDEIVMTTEAALAGVPGA